MLSDADGTLVTKEKILTERSRATIGKLKEAGICCTVTSSRPLLRMKMIVDALKSEDYRRLKAIFRGEERTQSDRVLSYAIYTEPQVGRVGMTLEEAQNKDINARCVTLPRAHIARGIEWGHDLGFYRMVVDRDTDKILGATLVGCEVGEIVHVFLSLMEAGATWQLLEQSVHIHPTYGEALPSLARLLIKG